MTNWQVTRPGFVLARTANGWCECRNWARVHTLFLYRRQGNRFTAATKKPLGDLAWDYFFSLPVSKSMHRDPKDRYSLDHQQANLLKGMEENYAWLGLNWADSRYVVIGLSFDIQGAERAGPMDRGVVVRL